MRAQCIRLRQKIRNFCEENQIELKFSVRDLAMHRKVVHFFQKIRNLRLSWPAANGRYDL